MPTKHKLSKSFKLSKFKICVSGAAAGPCLKSAQKLAFEVGREVVKQGAILTTGATTGIPYEAARGAKAEGGIIIGFSPAGSPREHVKKYRLPLTYVDVIVYTGFGYAGRNLLLTRGSDAVITICGRMGTLNEFTIAFEDQKIIGVLRESGGTADEIPHILETTKKTIKAHVIYDHDPARLVKKVLEEIRKRQGNHSLYYV
ncbi:MAG: hypothetical protein UX98_C0007G0004 [Parcubacteria group bacterium GW2011_GWA2_47_26]|nr:MAG: hypothetical protein UX98_C0007G0004 [Parcubacteria group bacterium GW2011_GWA2_47_26]